MRRVQGEGALFARALDDLYFPCLHPLKHRPNEAVTVLTGLGGDSQSVVYLAVQVLPRQENRLTN